MKVRYKYNLDTLESLILTPTKDYSTQGHTQIVVGHYQGSHYKIVDFLIHITC